MRISTTYITKAITLTVVLGTLSLVVAGQAFITTWRTDSPGISANNQITIPTTGGGYNYNIAWELVSNPAINGTLANQTGNTTITFPIVGLYRVSITGSFPRIYFYNDGNPSDAEKLNRVEQWGSIAWTSMEGAFWGCKGLLVFATDTPDLSNVTNFGSMFYEASIFNQDISGWDVSNVTEMDSMFYNARAFNQDISGWDVSNVVNMEAMFYGTSSFNQDIGAWNVASVTDMSSMFLGASIFNQDIGNWDVSNVTDMGLVFFGANAFNQDISAWDVANVTDMWYLFAFTPFNQDISAWDVGNVTNMYAMFLFATAFNQDIGSWDVGNVTNMAFMFDEASSFNRDIGGWEVGNATAMYGMFTNATAFNQNISGWNTGNVTTMGAMFSGATAFNQNIGSWDVTNVTEMSGMFFGATAFNQDLGNWDVSNVTNMGIAAFSGGMFQNATSFNQSLAGWDIGNVTNMEEMLSNSGVSDANYDATLIGWAAQTLQPNVLLGATGLSYCTGSPAHNTLTSAPNSWTITGDVLNCLITSIAIKENGTAKANGGDVAFSTVAIGTDLVKQLEIANTGTVSLVITNMQLTGNDYTLESSIPSPIDPGNSTMISIRFTPTALGARLGTLTILSNSDIPVFTVNLSGEGDVEPEVYNVVTTHKNGKHDFLNIKNINYFPQNKMSIFDRWGNKVFEHDSYDNVQVVFTGISDDNKELPEGAYYYVLDKNNGDKPIHGFIYLRK